MPSRRQLLRRIGASAATPAVLTTAGCIGDGTVRTKLGGASTDTIDFSSPDDDVFVPPNQVPAYLERIEAEYGEAAFPWTDISALAGEFVGAYTQQMEIVPDDRFAVQDAAVLVHRLDSSRYRLRAWTGGRLLGRQYEVGFGGHIQRDPAITWLDQALERKHDSELTTDYALSTTGGRVAFADGAVRIPEGSFDAEITESERYQTRWEGFYTGIVPLIGVCDVSFPQTVAKQLTWELSNGVGIRTPI
ncbi:hypothetical protein [Halobaculum lipolyticum]|uniref:DUF3298 domain-containing protein n=1 Tax=Halobaculum lipolyticum TaxID=3032001 RepID=A0ABD5WI50_9EURY|nr:hypothetical protein [Halobaculum sp. DT31]